MKPSKYPGQIRLDTNSSALFSDCGTYRYMLTRIWKRELPMIVWVMLNPSTADEEQDDPTIRRCINFSRKWGYGGLVVLNIFAYRSTDPRQLRAVTDPIGPENKDAFDHAYQMIWDSVQEAYAYNPPPEREKLPFVCAWGAHGGYMQQDETAMGWIENHWSAVPMCLGITLEKFPKHPLYIHGSTTLRPYKGRLGYVD